MPIDLKWVRSNPCQVRQWQNQRHKSATTRDYDGCIDDIDLKDDRSIDLVDTVLRKDELSRKKQHNLQEHKRNLKRLQLRLRPKSTQPSGLKKFHGTGENEPTDTMEKKQQRDKKEDIHKAKALPQSQDRREDLIEEKKALEAKIRLAEAECKASLKDTYMTLCELSSPVTAMESYWDINDQDAIKIVTPPLLLPDPARPKSSLGMDLEQAWRQYTLLHFSSYLWVELSRGISVEELSSGASTPASYSITPDRALEIWGCCAHASSSNLMQSSNKPSLKANDENLKILPSWIGLLTESLPKKSIWGEKELPRYTAIWGRSKKKEYKEKKAAEQDSFSSISGPFSLELVALTAPSVVDAREIQNNLVEELFSYYSGLLKVTGDGQNEKKILTRVVIAPPELHNHEWSRIEIHIQLRSTLYSPSNCNDVEGENSDAERSTARSVQTLRLGWVSHWGDAATRACDMSFAGAGVVQASGKKKFKSTNNASTKEYVHLVEASVIDDSFSMWNKILYINSNHCSFKTGSLKGNETQLQMGVPPVLVPYLIRPTRNLSRFTLADLVLDKKKVKKKETVFGDYSAYGDTAICHNDQEERAIPLKS